MLGSVENKLTYIELKNKRNVERTPSNRENHFKDVH